MTIQCSEDFQVPALPDGEWHCRTLALSFLKSARFSYVVFAVECSLEEKKNN